MKQGSEEDQLLSEYKRYVRFDFLVTYALAQLYYVFRVLAILLVPHFQSRFIEPRKERIGLIKKSLPISHRKKAYAYFRMHYITLILLMPAFLTLLLYLKGGDPNYKYYTLVGFMVLIASTGLIPAYYGIVEGQAMNSMIWGEDGYKKKTDPKERLKHPF